MSKSGAAIREEKLTIPAYEVGPPEKNPMFFAGRGYQGAKGPIYPYPLLDKLADAKRDRTYRAVVLENEYIKLSVLPEVGGRIFSGLDKTNGYDFLYRQSVIKAALIGMAGAWISGGIEWNAIHHHRVSTFMPVDYRVESGADGARTLWVGETERRQRMRWVVGLTIFPGRSYLEVTAKIFNPTPFAHSMLYFTNAAVHVNPGYQVIFPPSAEWGTQHAKCEFVRWPIATSVYAGVDYSGGVDVSMWKNHPHWISIFTIDNEEDFFGGYDHTKDAGIVHFADHHVWPGKKFFTFGAGPEGAMWDKILTDADGPYLELMSGAYSDNQPDYSWISPYETRTMTEWWYPVRQLGGVKNATADAAVNLEVDERNVARVGFNATAEFKGATVTLDLRGKTIFRRKIDIGPEKPVVEEVALPAGATKEDLRAVLASPSGRELVSYRPAEPKGEPMPEVVEAPPPPKEVKTSEELYLAGLRLEQFHNPALEPYPYYEEALRRDPFDCRANTALALLYLKRGKFAEAEEKLRRAVERATKNHTRPKDGGAHYYLGAALKFQGRHAEARTALNKAAWDVAWRAASQYLLAEIALREGDTQAALDAVEEAIRFNAANTRALCLRAVVLRQMKRYKEAADLAACVLKADPLDFLARNELALARQGRGLKSARRDLDELARLMRGEAQSHLELASAYEAMGLWGEAAGILERFLAEGGGSAVDPLVHYTLGHYFENMGDERKSARHYRLGGKMPPDYCFPFRLESIHVLESAIRHNPSDARAPYYLGNLLYDLQPERAVAAWEKSRELDDAFATVHRNLGFAYARMDKDNRRAIASLEKAVACDPKDPRLFFELDVLMGHEGVPHEKRLAVLEANHDTVEKRDYSLLREIVLYVLTGKYDRAIKLLDTRHFHIWEGGENSVHDVYVDAHLLRGKKFFDAGKFDAALADYEAASEYPERFEMGRPYDGGREPEVSYHIGTAYEALGEKEKALSAYRAALKKDKKGTYLAYYQGLALRKLGQEDKARALFDGLVRLGEDALATGAAVDFFGKFGAYQSESERKAHAHYLIGLGLAGRGETDAAKAQFEIAVRLDVNHLGARRLLAETAQK